MSQRRARYAFAALAMKATSRSMTQFASQSAAAVVDAATARRRMCVAVSRVTLERIAPKVSDFK